ncbi:MAG: efflux RND transporter periplasmic adaptor subunit [Verrucomicrobiales bacterium]
MKTIVLVIITLAIAVPTTWFVARRLNNKDATTADSSGGRKLLYYQSAMHPWIKSDKPGRCTICGMELTPVYEGDTGFDSAAGGDVLTLTQSIIQVMNVSSTEVKKLPLAKTLRVAGKVDDNATRHRVLSAYVPGRIEKLYVNFMGAEVTAGEPLADFYSPTLLQTEREFRTLTGELRERTALRLRQMGLSQEQIATIPNKSPNALASQILAPIGGTVVAQHVFEGQYVQEGEKLFEIADFSTMWFIFRAYEQDLPWIKPGLGVDVTTPSHPGMVFSGGISFIDPNFNDATRSTSVRVELENPLVEGRRLLLHRLYADGVVRLEAPEVLSAPRSAVIQTGPEAVAYVDKGGGAYERRELKLGRAGDELVEILSGLTEGEKVVTNGALLIDGQAEMNRSFAAPPAPESTTPASPALTDAEKKAVIEFVKVADAMAHALSADDLNAFHKASGPAMAATETFTAALNSRADWAGKLAALNEARHFHDLDDIKKARTAFQKFTVAATAVLEPLRRAEGAPEFAVWQCDMVDQAIAGAPKTGRWVQATGRPGHNPFFGKEMLECATPVKP